MALIPRRLRRNPAAPIQNLGDAWFWLEKLWADLAARQLDMAKASRYYDGYQDLPFLTETHTYKLMDEWRDLLVDSDHNFMELVVDTTAERLRVDGYRVSAAAQEPESRAWEIWQANDFDAESVTGMQEALVKGVSYVSVWKDTSVQEAVPTLAIEDAMQCIVGYAPGSNFRVREAALKVWLDDLSGLTRANVYLRDGIYKFVAKPDDKQTEPPVKVMDTGEENVFGAITPGGARSLDLLALAKDPSNTKGRWVFMPGEFVDNPFGVVPIVPLRNRPRLTTEGKSEIASLMPIQNGINGFLFLLALAGYFGAHKQRWATGLAIMKDANNKPVEPFKVGVDTLWATDNPATKFGEFGETSLEPYIKAIDQKVQHIATISRTPRHYLMPEGQEPSGDSLRSAESGLMAKVERCQATFGTGFENALGLALFMDSGTRPAVDAELVWADTSSKTLAEVTDATIKQRAEGLIDDRQALENLGYTQAQIVRILASDRTPPALPTPPASVPPTA